MNYFNPLEYDKFYHIYNHANGFENLFVDKNCYASFLSRLNYYSEPVIDIYSYNLLKNHFHILLKTKPEEVTIANSALWAKEERRPFKLLNAGKQLSDCFNSYTKTFNKVYSRTGSLFNHRYRRIEICGENKLLNMVGYIHTNAQHHGFVRDFKDWKYSSYHEAVGCERTYINRESLLELFAGKENFIKFHKDYAASIFDGGYWLE